MMIEPTPSATAHEILKLLQLGKTVTVQLSDPVEFSNLRSRLASLKAEQDKVLIGLGMMEQEQALLSSCRPNHDIAIDYILNYECTFKFGEKKEAKKYSIVSVD